MMKVQADLAVSVPEVFKKILKPRCDPADIVYLSVI
jgi:hypothetical protein